MKWILVFVVLYVHSNAFPLEPSKDDKVIKSDKPLEQHVAEVPKLDTEKSVADSVKTKGAVPDVEKKGPEIVEEKGHHEESRPPASNCDVPALRKKPEQKHHNTDHQTEQRGKKEGQRKQYTQHRTQHDHHENRDQHKSHDQHEEQHRNQHEPQHHNDHKDNGAAKDIHGDTHAPKKNSNVRAVVQPRSAATDCGDAPSTKAQKQVNKRDTNSPCARRSMDD